MLAFLLQTWLLAGHGWPEYTGCAIRNMWLSALATPVDIVLRQAHSHWEERLSPGKPGPQGRPCLCQSWYLGSPGLGG